MKKQGFTILLILLISMISTKALADASGSCGDNVTWTYVEATQTLTISGNGAMYNYDYSYSSKRSPWFGFREKLKTAVIEEGVTRIGSNAFCDCSGLTSVTIPNSVTSIGWGAFDNCTGLTSVTIPNSVTSIGSSAFAYTGWYNAQPDGILYLDNWLIGYKGSKPTGEITIKSGTKGVADYAFNYCSGLTSITIPNSVTSIGNYAFYGSGLTSVTIGNSVTSIGDNAFSGCTGLTSIKVESDNTKYDSRNNCNAIIETSTNTLILGCKNTTIPNSVTSIGEYAFNHCSGLASITIPNSVTSIGNYAFQDCSRLTSITIPNSVTSIGHYAFNGCI